METSQDQTIEIGNISVNYKIEGAGKPILILHGWGSSSVSWLKVQGMLAEKGYQVIVPDLPGFGQTPAPPAVWGVEEYAEFVKEFTEKLGLQKFMLIGHSFGGQTAVQFATTHPEKTEKLVLVAAAAVRHEPGLKAKTSASIAGILPKPVKKALSFARPRSDYGKAQGIMKDIMKKVIRQDVSLQLPKITMPTLIIWGDEDKETPVRDAYVMEELIPNSKLEIIPGGKHALNFQMPEKVAEKISVWL